MKRGIVIATDRRTLTVMTPTGDVFSLPRRRVPGAARVGQEVRFEPAERRMTPRLGLAGLAAAAALALALLAPGWLVPAAAVLTLDINPSLELSLTASGRVLSARGFDPAGHDLVTAVQPEGLGVEEAVERLVLHAAAAGYLRDGGTVVVAVVRRGNPPKVGPAADLDGFQRLAAEAVDRAAGRQQVRVHLVTARAQPDAVGAARRQRVSVGTFLVYQAALAQGLEITLEALKGGSVSAALQAAGADPERFLTQDLIAAPLAEQVRTGMVGGAPGRGEGGATSPDDGGATSPDGAGAGAETEAPAQPAAGGASQPAIGQTSSGGAAEPPGGPAAGGAATPGTATAPASGAAVGSQPRVAEPGAAEPGATAPGEAAPADEPPPDEPLRRRLSPVR